MQNIVNTQEQLHSKFKQIYEGLNAQQKKAVDTLEGPVMVIAGPGTGKTQILSARIGNILLHTDTLPENILCLTYTDAGVIAMRKRLKSFIGADAYRVQLHTFHSFCNDIIQNNLSYFKKNTLEPVSELEKIEIFKHLIDNLKNGNPLKRYSGNIYFEIDRLKNLFSIMKREGWNASYIIERIHQFITLIEKSEKGEELYKKYKYSNTTKYGKEGEYKPDFADLQSKMEQLKAAALEYENFQNLMQQRNRYDFDDMINWVINAFKDDDSLLLQYQEQFLYILVDEYQDTSGSQNAIVKLLINYWEKPNIFVVGDDDQSIYRFQGANVENMLQFADSLKQDLLTVVLTKNYRSVQPILDISKTLIENNEERLVNQIPNLSKELMASNTKLVNLTIDPLLHQYRTQQEEMIGVVLQIENLIKEGIAPGRIAVIYKEHKYGESLAKYLQFKNIPYYSKKSESIFQIPLAKKLISLLKYLYAEHDTPFGGDEMLFEILHFNCFELDPLDIAKLSIEVAKSNATKRGTSSIRQMLYDIAHQTPLALFEQEVSNKFHTASEAIESLIKDVANVTLQKLFENCLTKTGILKNVLESEDKHRQLKIITALFDFIKEETMRSPQLELSQLIETINLMQKEKIPIPLIEISGTETGVNLLTAHGSKGLEFEYVYLVGCIANTWEAKKKDTTGSFSFPDTIFDSTALGNAEEELRRLFYVALTRAEKHLIISYHKYDNKGKELVPSKFIAQIQAQPNALVEKVCNISTEDLDTFKLVEIVEIQKPEIKKLEEAIVSRLLEKFALSVTAVNNLLNCPLSFYFNQVLRIPTAKNAAMAFGSAIHYALETLFKNMQKNDKIFPSKEDFVKYFEISMSKQRAAFVETEYQLKLEHGQNVLNAYYDNYVNDWCKIVSIEKMIKNVVINGIPIKGKLDKIEFEGKQINVVDYKTGDFEKPHTKAKFKAPDLQKYEKKKDNDPLKANKHLKGGDYWRQAVFYKILLDLSTAGKWSPTSIEFDFVEPDKNNQYKKENKKQIVVSASDEEIVKEQIKEAWDIIQNRDFYTGCGSPDCDYCNFVKDNNLEIAMHHFSQEELEEEI